jgi:hypothetical protein
LALLASDGHLVKGRCGSSNLCEYCLIQELHVVRRMLSLDALDGPAPELLIVLGTGQATTDPAIFYRGRERMIAELRGEWGPQVEYSCLSEFTTGKSRWSGGVRRPHWNVAVKGIPASDHKWAGKVAIPTWCENVPNALPEAQYIEPLHNTAAYFRYVAEHFTKTSQQPPKGGAWRHKQRFNCSRDYFAPLTRAQARERAWWHLQREREIVKAQRGGESDPVAAADATIAELQLMTWVVHDRGAIQPENELVALKRRAEVNRKRWEAKVAR